MRVGLVRKDAALPNLEKQVDILMSSGRCAQIVEVENTGLSVRRLEKFLQSLAAGDVVCLVSLDVFSRRLGRVVRFLKSLGEASISVSIVSRNNGESLIEPVEPMVTLLQLLSVCETGRQSADEGKTVWHGRRFLPADEFTLHQRDHVHTLHAEGMSLRAIGLIFRTSPGEIWKVLAAGRRPHGKSTAGKNA